MLPYFYKLDTKIISTNLETLFTRIALDHIDKFTEHIDDNGNPDGNSYLYHDDFQTIPEIKEIKKNCSLDFYVLLYMHKPNVTVVKHRDNPKYRKSNIIHPLMPQKDYSPTLFFKTFYDNDFVTCNYENMLPVILNLSHLHSVQNNSHYRINLQFSFKEDFETIVDLYKNKKLFIQ